MKCSLKKGELFTLEATSENDLRCLKGLLWVTTGDGIDYLVTDSCPVKRLTGKKALIEALEDSEIRLQSPLGQAMAIRSGFERTAGFMTGV
ncbi:MAG: hypothetical protein HXX17_17010 [Geobacteraceae bacterium]|nr:hypothetical protein [Geobacteraceae bacterium]